ncbi:Rho termination factor N-terminal domain-containing protein [Arthrobacter alpinus]|nr:Rho termination factor N-terminal domain-containing protein [Arthrobacter alpinus]
MSLCQPVRRHEGNSTLIIAAPTIGPAIEGEGSFVTETVTSAAAPKSAESNTTGAPAKSAGLAGLKLAQLQALAGQLGITGGSRMRKGDLVEAISAHQRGSSVADRPVRSSSKAGADESAVAANGTAEKADSSVRSTSTRTASARTTRRGSAAKAGTEELNDAPAANADVAPNTPDTEAPERPARGRGRSRRATSSDGVITTDSGAQSGVGAEGTAAVDSASVDAPSTTATAPRPARTTAKTVALPALATAVHKVVHASRRTILTAP